MDIGFKTKVVALRHEGLSFAAIAAELTDEERREVSPETIRGIIASLGKQEKSYNPRLAKNKELYDKVQDTLRNNLILLTQVRSVIELAYEEDKEISLAQVIRRVREDCDTEVTPYFVRRSREALDFVSKWRKYGTFVRPSNAVKRVEWCVAKKASGTSFLTHAFTDECAVWLDGHSNRVWVKRSNPFGHVEQKPKHLAKVMIWMGISWKGCTPIAVIEGNIASTDYQEILRTAYLPWNAETYGGHCMLVQDGAPPHTSLSTKRWLQEHNVQVEDWPSESPDLNPVELVWAHMKHKLRTEYKPKSVGELKAAIEQYRLKYVTVPFCQKLIGHIFKAMDRCIEKNGAATNH